MVNKANLITDEQEDYLWENGFLGSENAELLCHTLVWIFGIQFALRAGQEHSYRYNVTNRVMNSYSIWRISVKLIMVD